MKKFILIAVLVATWRRWLPARHWRPARRPRRLKASVRQRHPHPGHRPGDAGHGLRPGMSMARAA